MNPIDSRAVGMLEEMQIKQQLKYIISWACCCHCCCYSYYCCCCCCYFCCLWQAVISRRRSLPFAVIPATLYSFSSPNSSISSVQVPRPSPTLNPIPFLDFGIFSCRHKFLSFCCCCCKKKI